MIKRTISKNTKKNTQVINDRNEVFFHKEIFSSKMDEETISINNDNRDGFFTTPVASSVWDDKVDNGELVSKFPHRLNHKITYNVTLTNSRETGGAKVPLGIYIADVVKAGEEEVEIDINLKIEPLVEPKDIDNIDDLCVIDIVDCNVPIKIKISKDSEKDEIKYCIRVKKASDVTIEGARLSGNDTYHPLSIEASEVKLASTSLQDNLTFYVKKASLALINANIDSLKSLSISHKKEVPPNGELDASIYVGSELYQWMIDKKIINKDISINIQNSKIFEGFQNIFNGTYDKVEGMLQESNQQSSYQDVLSSDIRNDDSFKTEKKIFEDAIASLSGRLISNLELNYDANQNISFSVSLDNDPGIELLTNQYVVVDLMVYGAIISNTYHVPGFRQQILAIATTSKSTTKSRSITYIIPSNIELGKLLQEPLEEDISNTCLYFAAPKILFDTSEYISRQGDCIGSLNRVYQFSNDGTTEAPHIWLNTNSIKATRSPQQIKGLPFDWNWPVYSLQRLHENGTYGVIIDTIDTSLNNGSVTLKKDHLYVMCFEILALDFEKNAILRSGIMKSNKRQGVSLSFTIQENFLIDNNFSNYRCHFNLFKSDQEIQLGPYRSLSNEIFTLPFIEANCGIGFDLIDFAIYDVTDIFNGVETLISFCSNDDETLFPSYGGSQKDQYLFGPSNLVMYTDESKTSSMSNLARNPYGDTTSTAFLLDNYFFDFRIKASGPNTLATNQIGFGPSKKMSSEEPFNLLYSKHVRSIRINSKFNIIRPFFNVFNYSKGNHIIVNPPQMKQHYTGGAGLLCLYSHLYSMGVVGSSELIATQDKLIVYPISRYFREGNFTQLPEDIQRFIKKNQELVNDLQETEEFYLVALSLQDMGKISTNGRFNFKIIFDDHFKINEYFFLYHEFEKIEWKSNENLSINSIWGPNIDYHLGWTIDWDKCISQRPCYFGFKEFNKSRSHPQKSNQGHTVFLDGFKTNNAIIMYNNPNNEWLHPVIDQDNWDSNGSNSPILYK